jgi:hypothetical protein
MLVRPAVRTDAGLGSYPEVKPPPSRQIHTPTKDVASALHVERLSGGVGMRRNGAWWANVLRRITL